MRTVYLLAVLVVLNLSTFAQKKYKIEVLSFNSVKSDASILQGARRLIGNVKFKQDSTIMECDSAYFYTKKNMFDAFSNVHLYKLKDSNKVDVKSDFLRHLGDQKMALFRNNVVLNDTKIILRTDSLDYDLNAEIGYYLYGAEIEDSATTLISEKGHYYSKEHTIYFKDSVVVNHNKDEYQLFTDTLKYNTDSKIAYFFGPTHMVNDTNDMYADFGWYNTQNNQAFFKKNALLTNPKQSVEADSIFVDREKKYGIAYSNVIATDSVEKIVATGNYLEVYENMETILITDSAMIKAIVEEDSIFLHSDTIFSALDTTNLPVDSLGNRTDSIDYRYFKAFHHVKIFKSNFQSKSDSLYFTTKDSIVRFYGNPVLWAEKNQITADYIEAFLVNQVLERFKLYEAGFIISQQDTSHFNQIKGKEIVGYFKNNKLHKIDVKKKSQTYYFPDDKGEIIGINKTNSENITIYMKENKVRRIIYRKRPNATMYPLKDVLPKDMKMKDFIWLEDWQPKKPSDIFWWEQKK